MLGTTEQREKEISRKKQNKNGNPKCILNTYLKFRYFSSSRTVYSYNRRMSNINIGNNL